MAQQNNRARQQRILMIFILTALLLLVGGAYAILGGDSKNSRTTPPDVPAGRVAVPVAIRNIQLGERVSGNMIKIRYFAPAEVPPDAFLKLDMFIGRYATQPILQATYFKASNISEADVTGGYSAVTKPGKRVVVINANLLPGAIGTLRVGDHVDLLSIGTPDQVNTAATSGDKSLADKIAIARGGTQPGAPVSRRNKAPTLTPETSGMTAMLIAENAEVMRVPSRGRDQEHVVLQMWPQDAHVTTLMVASGATLRVVFRPYHDEERITKEKDLQITTRIPKPEPDPDRVTVITGNLRATARPDSQRYATAEQNPYYGQQNALRNQNFSDTLPPQHQPPLQTLDRDFGQPQVYE